MERIVLRDIILNHNRIEYITENSEGIADAFRKPFEYWIEYNENVEAVPTSIAVIPFVCNVLPIVWVMDAELFVPEIDEDFYNSLENTRDAYIKMYPNIQFKGKISAARIVKNVKTFHNEKRKATAFFSGGVDSWATLVSHVDENEINLVTIWGADIKLDDDKSWKKVENYTQKVADNLNLKAVFIKSTFRESLNYTFLDNLISGKVRNNSWWYFIQHGIALIGHVAPYAYLNNIDLHYIPASCSVKDRNKQLASYKTIDETVKMAWCDVVHDQFELLRIERLKKIIDWRSLTREEVVLRVCYSDDANGSNCCRCEKCYRTILEILSCNHNPADFGFNFSFADIIDVQIYFYENHKRLFVDKDYYYKRIIENVVSNRRDLESTGLFKHLKWLIDAEDIRKLKKVKSVRKYILKTKIYKILHR